MTADLVVASPVPGTDLVPDGWCESTVMPWADEQAEVGPLAQAAAKLAGLQAAYKTLGDDALELTKARRYVEVRWGELLGPAKPGPPDKSSPASEDSLTPNARHDFRAMAAPEVRERIVETIRTATESDTLSRAALLREAKPSNATQVTNNSGHIEWYTPAEFVDAARTVMGGIDLDPASCADANKVIRAERFYGEADNGLAQEWSGRVWMNPPYANGTIDKFCTKLRDAYVGDQISEAVVLVNSATETGWFQSLGRVANAICFPSRRISFWRPDRDVTMTGLQGQAFLYFGEHVKEFRGRFSQFGLTVVP